MRHLKPTFLFLFVISTFICSLYGQSSDIYRNKNWKPKQGKYYFSEQWTWSYDNEFVVEDEFRKKGEMTVYVDSATGTFLFTQESYGMTGEMVDFVIADQKGNYIFGYTDERGKKYKTVYKSLKLLEILKDQSIVQENFNQYCNKSGEAKTYDFTSMGGPSISGEGYNVRYEKTNETSNIFILLKHNFSMLPIYFFNQLDTETKLPINQNNAALLPKNCLVLEDIYQFGGQKSIIKLTSTTPTEYFIDVKPYKLIK